MTDEQTDGRDERELPEDLEPTVEAAQVVSGGRDGPNLSDIPIVKHMDKPSP